MAASSRSAQLQLAVFGIVMLGLVAVVPGAVSAAAGDHEVEEVFGVNEASLVISQRHLLQTLQPCSVDFASMNYTSITSVCNGSDPNKVLCCSAFVNFACPYATQINDQTTNCASTMFSYLNLAGHYPPALFSSLCQGNEVGLPCPLVPAPAPSNPSSASLHMPSTAAMLLSTLLVISLFSWYPRG